MVVLVIAGRGLLSRCPLGGARAGPGYPGPSIRGHPPESPRTAAGAFPADSTLEPCRCVAACGWKRERLGCAAGRAGLGGGVSTERQIVAQFPCLGISLGLLRLRVRGKSSNTVLLDFPVHLARAREWGRPGKGNTMLPLSDHGITKMQSSRWQAEKRPGRRRWGTAAEAVMLFNGAADREWIRPPHTALPTNSGSNPSGAIATGGVQGSAASPTIGRG